MSFITLLMEKCVKSMNCTEIIGMWIRAAWYAWIAYHAFYRWTNPSIFVIVTTKYKPCLTTVFCYIITLKAIMILCSMLILQYHLDESMVALDANCKKSLKCYNLSPKQA